jgi:hypothetical protein
VAVIDIRLDGTSIVDDVLFAQTQFTALADGQPGLADIVVKNDKGQYSPSDFITGMTLELYIDGQREWDGWLFDFKRTWPFETMDTSSPWSVPKYWKLRGLDRNLLFQKRFIYDQDAPANMDGLVEFDGETTDRTALLYYVNNYVNLTGDGLSTSGIKEVASPGQGGVFTLAHVGAPWGLAFDDCAKMSGAVFYIDPDRVIHYRGDTDVNAPFTLTDTPGDIPGSKGVSDLEWDEDFANAATDALVWGAGYGSRYPVFARHEGNIEKFGRWQWGDLFVGAYKQATVNKRARTYVEGSPSNRRGHGKPVPVVRFTLYTPGLRVGMVALVVFTLFGLSHALPVRKMTITFPTTTSAKYDVEMNLNIDAPFSAPDLWKLNDWKRDSGDDGGDSPNSPPESNTTTVCTGAGLIDHYDQGLGDVVFYCGGSWYGGKDQPAPLFDGLVGTWPGTFGRDNGFITRFKSGGARKTWMTNPEGWSEVHGMAADHTGVYASIYGGVGGYMSGAGAANYANCGVEKWSPDGVRLWKYIDPDWFPPVSMHARDGFVVAGSSPAIMFDAETGDVLWTRSIPGWSASAWCTSGGEAWVISPDNCRYIDSTGALIKAVATPFAVENAMWHGTSAPDFFYATTRAADNQYNLYSIDLSGDDAVLTYIALLAAPDPGFPPYYPVFSVDQTNDDLYGFGGYYYNPGSPPITDTRWTKKWVNGVEAWYRKIYTENDYLNLSTQLSAGGLSIMAGGDFQWKPLMYVFEANGDRLLQQSWANSTAEVASRQHWNMNAAAVAPGEGFTELEKWATPGPAITGADPAVQPGGNAYARSSAGSVDISGSYVWVRGWMDLYSHYYVVVGPNQGDVPEWVDPEEVVPVRPWGKTPFDLLVRFKRPAGPAGIGHLQFEFWNNDLDPSAVAAWSSEQLVSLQWDDDVYNAGTPETFIYVNTADNNGVGITDSVYPDGLGTAPPYDWRYYSGSAEGDFIRRLSGSPSWAHEIKKTVVVEQDVEYALRIQLGAEVVDPVSNLKTLRVKLWKDADPEPAAWDIDHFMGTYRYGQETYLGHPNETSGWGGDENNDMLEIDSWPGEVGIQGLWRYGAGECITISDVTSNDVAESPKFISAQGDRSNYQTQYPYVAGTLKVYVGGAQQMAGDFLETTPATGMFALFDPNDRSSNMYVTYVRSSSDANYASTGTYRPKPVTQYGWGSALDGHNCNMAAGCVALDRHTLGNNSSTKGTPRATPPIMRSYQYDQSGGTDLGDLATAWSNGWQQTLQHGLFSWATFVANIRGNRGAVLHGRYANLPASKRFSDTFLGGHALFINEELTTGHFLGFDPLTSASVVYSAAELQAYAEGLSWVGAGQVSAGFTRVTD